MGRGKEKNLIKWNHFGGSGGSSEEFDGYQGSVLGRLDRAPLNPKDNTDCSLGIIPAILFRNKEQKTHHIFCEACEKS